MIHCRLFAAKGYADVIIAKAAYSFSLDVRRRKERVFCKQLSLKFSFSLRLDHSVFQAEVAVINLDYCSRVQLSSGR